MSSWSYGNIRFRGLEMDILNMLKNEIGWCGTDKVSHVPVHHNPIVKKNKFGEPTVECPEDVKKINWNYPGFYFKSGNRSILGDGLVIFPAYRHEYSYENEEDERVVWVFDGFHEAYGVEISKFQEIAKKYRLDIRINVWDQGFESYTNVVILADGEVEKYEMPEYKDWAWESEMPQMGG